MILLLTIILLVLVFGYFLAGNVFYDIGIKRSRKRLLDNDQDMESVLTRELKPDEKLYWENLKEWEKQHLPEKINVLSYNKLKLNGYIYKNEKPTNKWIIVVHGYNNQGLDMVGFVYEFYSRGFNVLAPDCRGHGLSEGKYIGMGWHDRKDIMLWIK